MSHRLSMVRTLLATASVFLLTAPLAQAALYAPGATLDPACAPTDPDCGVQAPVGAGTPGQVPYYAAAGGVLTATSSITILSNGNVGIGTTTPSALLSVHGNSYTSGTAFFGGAVTATSSAYLATAGGKVGIGTASPYVRLSNYDSNVMDSSGFGLLTTLESFAWSSSGAGYVAAIENRDSNSVVRNGLLVKTAATDTGSYIARFESGGANRLSIRSDGNVGIGTTSPSSGAKLEVSGGDLVVSNSGSTLGALRIRPFNSGGDGVNFDPQINNGNFYFGRDNTLTKFVVQSGLVGIGNTTPTYLLDVSGLGHFTGLVDAANFIATSTTATSTFAGGFAAGNNAALVVNRTATANSLYITGGGNIGIGTTSPASLLSVQGNGYFSGSAFFGGAITATSTLNITGLTTLGNASTTVLSSTGSAYFATTNGNVGIGTTTPGQKLSVAGDILGNIHIGSNFVATSSSATSTFAGGATFAASGGNFGIGTSNPTGGILHVLGNTFLNGSVAMGGTAIDPTITIVASNSVTDPSSGSTEASFTKLLTLTGSNAQTVTGGSLRAVTSANAFNQTGMVRGGFFEAQNSNTATVSNLYAGDFLLYNVGAGTVTNGVGANILIQNNNASGVISSAYGAKVKLNLNNGTLTNTYGYYVDDITTGTQTNTPYSFYASDANTYNYFAGNTGVGLTTPSYKLDVTGLGHFTGLVDAANFVATSTSATSTFAGGFTAGNNAAFVVNRAATANSLHISSGGNVGIGTGNPNALLDISNAGGAPPRITYTNAASFSGLRIYENATEKARIQVLGSTFATTDRQNDLELTSVTGDIGFAPNDTLAVTFKGSGNVGIGTTNPSTFKLQVAGNIGPNVTNTSNLGSAGLAWECLYYDSGTLGTCASDQSLKENIVDLQFGDALGKVSGLRLRSYNFKSDVEHSVYDGLIAQEVETVAPELVVTDPITGLKAVKYGQIQWLTISAVQQLYALVQGLTASVAELVTNDKQHAAELEQHEAEIKALQARVNALEGNGSQTSPIIITDAPEEATSTEPITEPDPVPETTETLPDETPAEPSSEPEIP